MAFLTAASPCALAIGTPATVLSGIARSARIGVLIKGAFTWKTSAGSAPIALDKTGTLTRGHPAVTDVVPVGQAAMTADALLSLAAAVEKSSSHPLARAIVDEATARKLQVPPADNVEQIPARGMTAARQWRGNPGGKAGVGV